MAYPLVIALHQEQSLVVTVTHDREICLFGRVDCFWYIERAGPAHTFAMCSALGNYVQGLVRYE